MFEGRHVIFMNKSAFFIFILFGWGGQLSIAEDLSPKPPEQLYIALEIAGDWLIKRSNYFDDVGALQIPSGWNAFDGEQSSTMVTYISRDLNNRVPWFASHHALDLNFWTIYVPASDDFSVMFKVNLNLDETKKGKVVEVRFIYPFLNLHGIKIPSQ